MGGDGPGFPARDLPRERTELDRPDLTGRVGCPCSRSGLVLLGAGWAFALAVRALSARRRWDQRDPNTA